MLSFKIYSKDLEDRMLVPFYQVKRLTKHYPLTIGKVSKEIINGIDIRDYKKEGTPYLRGTDIKRCQVDLNSPKKVKMKLNEIPDRIKLKVGDVLITRKGTAGITSIVSSDCVDCIIGTEIIRVRLKKNANITPEYLYTLLNSKVGILQISGKLTGTVSRGINHPSLKSIKIPLLEETKQKQIDKWVKDAKRKHQLSLRYINEALKILKEKIKNYEEDEKKYFKIYSNILQDMITPKFYYPQYVDTINNLKKKFKTKKLGEIADIGRGQEVGSDNYRTYLDKVKSDVPFIRTSDLPNFEIDDWSDYYVDINIYEELNQDVEEGDIIFSKDGKIGITALYTSSDKSILASGLSIIKPHNKKDAPYIFAVLSSFVGSFQADQRSVTSSTIPHLNMERMHDIEIPILDEETKKEITKNVKKAFKLKAEKKLLIKRAKELIENVFLKE